MVNDDAGGNSLVSTLDVPRIPSSLRELATAEQKRWRELRAQIQRESWLTGSVGASGWVAICDGQSPAAAGTARTMLNVIAGANRQIKLTEVGAGFIGALGTAKPVLIEVCQSTQAGGGSGSSAVTPVRTDQGGAQTVQSTAAKNYATTEPTTLTAFRRWRVHPQAGAVIQFPLGREPVSDVGKALCVRITFESGETITNVDLYAEWEE